MRGWEVGGWDGVCEGGRGGTTGGSTATTPSLPPVFFLNGIERFGGLYLEREAAGSSLSVASESSEADPLTTETVTTTRPQSPSLATPEAHPVYH